MSVPADGNLAEFRCTRNLIQNVDDMESIAPFCLPNNNFTPFIPFKYGAAHQKLYTHKFFPLLSKVSTILFSMPRV